MSGFIAAGFPAAPTPMQMFLLQSLVTTVLDPLREAIGRPIVIDSGSYRDEAKYQAMLAHYNPSPTSDHFWAQAIPAVTEDVKTVFGPFFTFGVGAVDVTFPQGPDLKTVFDRVRSLNLPVGQCILESSGPNSKWIHLSNPKQLCYTQPLLKALNMIRPQYMTSTDNGKTYQAV